jgi:hypothetical protein
MTVSMSRWLYQQILLAAAMLKHFILSLLAFPSTPFSPSHLLASSRPSLYDACPNAFLLLEAPRRSG